MAISEESRHHLYQRLEEVLGVDDAATLMEHLPPVGWADVATKRDLDALAAAMKRDTDDVRREIRELATATNMAMANLGLKLNARLERELRLMSWRFLTALIAAGGIVVAGIKL